MKADQVPPYLKYVIVGGLTLVLGLVDVGLLHFSPKKDANSFKFDGWDVTFALVNAFIPSLIAYLSASFFLRYAETKAREEELQRIILNPIERLLQQTKYTVIPTLEEINWALLFEGATNIQLLVQGWAVWKDDVDKYLPDFFRRGGVMHLVLHDPNKPELLNPMALRLGETFQGAANEINRTIETLRQVVVTSLNLSGPNDIAVSNQFKLHFTDRLNWYCGILFNPGGKLILSLYRHRHTNPRPPSFLIREEDFPSVVRWFETEWKSLYPNYSDNAA